MIETEEAIYFLLNVFPQHKGKTMKGSTLQAYYDAERIFNGWDDIKKRSCGCTLGGLQREVDSQYDNWLLKYEHEK